MIRKLFDIVQRLFKQPWRILYVCPWNNRYLLGGTWRGKEPRHL